ncbi:hypothetical protein AYI69_g9797 [Smittium culicis]|uniref:Uncharacterized protein n=1 Tax=Smittium culicis TaxID=133412 RepID=A0A1R1XA71_9FUNG|nr:hypothetical protein AYI69_g9797 [Smittium culicis]
MGFLLRKKRSPTPALIQDNSAEKLISNANPADKKVAKSGSADALKSGSQEIPGKKLKRIVVEQVIKSKEAPKLISTSIDEGKVEKGYLDQLENLIGNDDSTPTPTSANVVINKNETVFQTQLETQFETEFETQNQTKYNTVNVKDSTRYSTISVTKSAQN